MATLAETYRILYQAGAFGLRVQVALGKAAAAVLNEDPTTINHTARIAWASSTIKNLPDMLNRIMIFVVNDPVIGDKGITATDDQIYTAILWAINPLTNIV